MKIFAVGFCIYNPEAKFFSRLEDLKALKKVTYIYDNSPVAVFDKGIRSYSNRYYHDSLNSGLGIGLNWILREAFLDGYKYLIYFDQDTIFTKNTISFIDSFLKFNQFPENFSSIQILSKSLCGLYHPVIDGLKKAPLLTTTFLQINSGSIFNLPIMNSIGFHDKSFFIDCVDYSHCLNSAIYKYSLGSLSGVPDFDHDSELGYVYYSLFGKSKGVRKYNFLRIFDYSSSILRLSFKALFHFQFYYFILFVKLFFLYISDQIFVRFFTASHTNE